MQKNFQISIDQILSKKFRVLWHILLWLIVILFYTLFFGHQNDNYRYTFQFVLLLLPITIATSYFFIYFLIPRYFETKRYGRFLMFSVYTLLISVYLEMMAVFGMLFIYIFEGGAPLDPTTLDIYFLIVAMFFVVLFVVVVKVMKSWFQRQQLLQDLTHQKLEAELKMLKAQIQPHFLFNSLNSIYSLSLVKSDRTPEMVLKLSEILDYLLYECDAQMVPLEREIKIIRNYFDLQKIRFGNRVNLSFNTHIVDEASEIAPMLLMPFAENCFKHSVSVSKEIVNIEVSIEAKNDLIHFTIINDIPDHHSESGKHGGIGLSNITRRLEVVYPERYLLNLNTSNNRFHVTLQINPEEKTNG